MWNLLFKLFFELPVKILLLPFTLARFIVRRSWMFIILAIVATVLLVPGISLLESEGGLDTLVSPDSRVFKDTEILEREFGGDPLLVMLKGSVNEILTPEGLIPLDRFEKTFGPDADPRVHSIISPVTILKVASEESARLGYEMEWNAPILIDAIVGDSLETMRPEMAQLIPDSEHILTTVSFSGDIDYDTSVELLGDIMAYFETKENLPPNTGVVVTGDLKMMEEIADAISSNMAILLALSVGVMAFILIVAFRVRWNLLALCMAGLATLLTFGVMGYLNVPLSAATMAVLPILIGLGIDYSIQFHKRYQEEAAKQSSVDEALTISTARMFPSVGIALLSTVIGFITLYISEVPMIRDFGLMLAIGMLISYGVAFFTLTSILRIHERRLPTISLGRVAEAATRYMQLALAFLAKVSLRFPLILLLLALSMAVAGAVVDDWLPTNSDFESLMPQNASVLDEIDEVREVQGFMGRARFIITADDVTDPMVLEWLQNYQMEMIDRYGVGDDSIDFGEGIIEGVDSPVTLITAQAGGELPEREEVDVILASIPDIFEEQFISSDRGMGHMSFYINYDSVEDLNDTIDKMVRDAETMSIPEVEMAIAGSTALGAKAVNSMVGNRLLMNVLCVSATFLVLFMVYRRLTEAVFAIIPVILVIGWSSLGLYLAQVALNPMTAILGVLVVGIGTEFMVLILSRYQEERKAGKKEPQEAMVTAISTTGQAIVTTALTTLGGFGVLMSSDFVLIRDFGIATTIAVFLCLLSSMIVMPPLIVWWDRNIAQRIPSWL